jgi:hypothetical protein
MFHYFMFLGSRQAAFGVYIPPGRTGLRLLPTELCHEQKYLLVWNLEMFASNPGLYLHY